ncbi:MAG: hypothetical protein ACRD9L_11690 [Bryobacteraceae bacterium]
MNVSNTAVTNVTINNYYRNRTMMEQARYVNRRSMTAVPANAMGNGRPVYQSAMRVTPEQMRSARLAQAPSVAPTRQAVMGRIASGPVRRPPVAVMNREVVARTAPPVRGQMNRPAENPRIGTRPGTQPGQPGGFPRENQPREKQRPGFERPNVTPRPAPAERQVERPRPSESPRPQVARPSEGPRPARTERPQERERPNRENRREPERKQER